MKKRLILGDVHGRGDTVIDIYNKELPDSVILLGDYFDSHEGITSKTQLDSFNKILELRSIHRLSKKEEFTMLFGNHDYHYLMDDPHIRYSSWSHETFKLAHTMLENCYKAKVFSLVFIDEQNKTIYSHAGITNYWDALVSNEPDICKLNENIDLNTLAFNYHTGIEWSGDTISQSPIWVRPRALLSDMYKDNNDVVWTQIVGHTATSVPIENGHPYGGESKPTDKPIWIIEGLGYYIVETIDNDGTIIKREIKAYEN